jgi:hypothetical protein
MKFLYLLPIVVLFSCKNSPVYSDRSKTILEGHLEEFQAYKNRPDSDGPFNTKEFLLENIPYLYSEDKKLTKVYNYRWWMISKHIRPYEDPEDGKKYTVFTEFFGVKPWASRSGAIPCPAGHQFHDLRWLKDDTFLKSYIEYFISGSASYLPQRENANFLTYLSRPEALHYSSWMIHGTENFLKVHPDTPWLNQIYTDLERHQALWDSLFLIRNGKTAGLYKIMDLYDGMEFSLSAVLGLNASEGPYKPYHDSTWKNLYLGWGTTSNAAKLPEASQYPEAFRGGYPALYLARPSINSYMYGNLRSLSTLSEILNKTNHYGHRASVLQQKILSELWSQEDQFFHTVTAGDNKYGIRDYMTRVRESVGYTPWYFNLIPKDQASKYANAWQELDSEDGFAHHFGMTTAERRHPYYNEEAYAWNGRGWPFQNAMVLKALANHLRSYNGEGRKTFLKLVKQLVQLHGDSELNIGEWYIPSRGPSFGGEKDYFHSSFPDMVIEDLIGLQSSHLQEFTLQPYIDGDFYLGNLKYHGHMLQIERVGQTLKVWKNGKAILQAKDHGQVHQIKL